MPRNIYAERAKRRVIHAWSVAIGLCLLAMFGMIALGAGENQAPDTTDLQGRLNAANKQSKQLVQQIGQSKQRIQSVQRELASANQIVDQPDLKLLLQVVGQNLGDKAMLTRVHLGVADNPTIRQTVGNAAEPERRWLVVAGIAEDHQAVPAIVLRLEALDLFDHVVLHETFAETYRGQSRVGFRIACRFPVPKQEGVSHD